MFSRLFFTSKFPLRPLTIVERTFSRSSTAKNSAVNSEKNNDELVKIVVDSKTKIGTLTLNRAPANALSTQLMIAIKDAVHELERQKVLGLILTSSSDRIFSAGLDLKEAYNRRPEDLRKLWTSLQDMWKALFSTKLPTAALINGHAIAGGCVLTMCCDFRVILPNFTFGLNETRAGIAVPSWVIDTYLNITPSRRVAEADLIEGRLYKSDGALNVGLVDALVDTREQALEQCLEFLKSYDRPTKSAMAQTKLNFRAEILKDFENNREKDVELFLNNIQRTDVQEFLGNYLSSFGKKGAQRKA